MRKGTDLLNKLRNLDSIPSKIDYNKIQGDGGGWTLEPDSKKFDDDIPEILQSQDLTTDRNDYQLITADQDLPYIAEDGELIEVSSNYINRDFTSFRYPYLLTRVYSNTIIKDLHPIATLILGANRGSIHQLV